MDYVNCTILHAVAGYVGTVITISVSVCILLSALPLDICPLLIIHLKEKNQAASCVPVELTSSPFASLFSKCVLWFSHFHWQQHLHNFLIFTCMSVNMMQMLTECKCYFCETPCHII